VFCIAFVIATKLWLRHDQLFLGDDITLDVEGYFFGVGVVFFSMRWIATAGLASGWHRFVMLNEPPSIRLGLPSRRSLRYFARCLFLSIAIYAPYLAIMHVIDIEWIESDTVYWLALWAPMFLIAMIVTRFSLLLPAVAIDEERMTLRSSWEFTEGNTGRLFVGLCAVTLPVLVSGDLVQKIQYFPPIEILPVVGPMIIVTVICLHLITGALAATYLSFIYQRLVGAHAEGAA
jgi:hypothetical protein